MGTLEQKMLIAFRIYDVDNDENISQKEVEIVLRSIPISVEGRYGISFSNSEENKVLHCSLLKKSEYLRLRSEDISQCIQYIDVLFMEHPDGIYFDEFVSVCTEVNCELYQCIYDCIYQHVPCAQTFL